jgi:uncharacterized protein YeaO (DUF488 family)
MIRTRSLFSAIEPSKDGLPILAARFGGRGLPSSGFHVWMADLGPTGERHSAALAQRITWGEFRRRYRKELFEGRTIERRNRLTKNRGQKVNLRLLQKLAKRETVTVVCHCDEDELHCHRHILKFVLQQKI